MQFDMRRPWSEEQTIFLVGPGGVGKSTLGRELAAQMNRPLIDLDHVFCREIEVIGAFIDRHGYAAYRAENLALAARLVAAMDAPGIFVTASGFLAAARSSEDYEAARALLSTGYTIALLPSLDLAEATALVVARQLTRGFGLVRETEEQKFLARFHIYKDEGDLLAIANAPAAQIAEALIERLHAGQAGG